MFEQFSEAARRAIFLARSEANRLGFDEIDTPHLLLGLLLENAGERDSLRLLSSISENRMCIPREHSATAQWSFLTPENADQLRTRFTIPGPRSSAPLPKNADMPLSSRAGKVLATAFDHAGDRWVTTLDLLWAMLGDDQQEVAESINAVGINREQIDQEIRRSRGRHKPGFEEFSGAARRSIFFARFEAGRLGFDEIDTPHLLLGLLLENAGERDFIRHLSSISEEISEDRISIPREHSATAQWPFLTPENADQLRTKFTVPGPRNTPLPGHAEMRLSSRAGKVLTTAFDHAGGDRWVTTLDLLWAMLSDDQQEVAESINAAGINREQIDEEIRRGRSINLG